VSDNFQTGMAEADSGQQVPQETEGARYGVVVRRPGPNAGPPLSEPYLMPTVASKNGDMEQVTPAIVHTPLGALLPGPQQIPPVVTAGVDYRQPIPPEAGGFDAGVRDGWPEGSPVPIS